MQDLHALYFALTLLIFPSAFPFFSTIHLPGSDITGRVALRQNRVDTCGLSADSVFGSQVLVLPDSLSEAGDIADALEEGRIVVPDSILVIPSFSAVSCSTVLFVGLDSLKSIFGTNILGDQVNDAMLQVEFYAYEYNRQGDPGITGRFYRWQLVEVIRYLSRVILPLNTYALRLMIQDSCGVVHSGLLFFKFRDEVPPVARCRDNVMVFLQAQADGIGHGALRMKDINDGSSDNCPVNIYGFINRQVRRKIEQPEARTSWEDFTGQPLAADSLYTPWADNLHFFCADNEQLIELELQITDTTGNKAVCQTEVLVLDTLGVCPVIDPAFGFWGTINTEEGIPVPEVRLRVAGHQNRLTTSDLDGAFDFFSLPPGGDYRLTPTKADDPTSGVSTLDLIQIQKHILGKEALGSPYKMIAADVNQSGSVSVLDLIQLQKLILNLDTPITEGQSWRFVPVDYSFPDPENPWQEDIPESIYVEDLYESIDASFIAIKVGDVNNSALLNN